MSRTYEYLDNISSQVTALLQRALDDLAWIRSEVQILENNRSKKANLPIRADFEGIQQGIKATLSRVGSPMDRLGIAMSVDFLADQSFWMEWWGKSKHDSLEFVGHSLNPQRDAFYDYSSRPWFTVPANTRTATASGPYVDYGGFNSYSYTVTVAVPISVGNNLLAVAGADIIADRFEEFLRPGQIPTILVNSGSRVITSNTGAYLPGDLVDEQKSASWHCLPLASDLFPVSGGWRLLCPTQ